MLKLKTSISDALALRLRQVLAAASTASKPSFRSLGPPLRFYVEGWRVLYQLEPDTRRVVVLELRTAFA